MNQDSIDVVYNDDLSYGAIYKRYFIQGQQQSLGKLLQSKQQYFILVSCSLFTKLKFH